MDKFICVYPLIFLSDNSETKHKLLNPSVKIVLLQK